jgi:hypothetical protein
MKTSLALILSLALTHVAHAQGAAASPDEASRNVMQHWSGNWTGGVAGASDVVVPHIATVPDHAKVEWTLGNHYLQGVNFDKDNKPVGVWLMRYNPKSKKYQVWFFSSQGDASLWNGTWDEARQTMTWETRDDEAGVKGTGHTTIKGNQQDWTMSVTKDGKTQESSGSLTRQ